MFRKAFAHVPVLSVLLFMCACQTHQGTEGIPKVNGNNNSKETDSSDLKNNDDIVNKMITLQYSIQEGEKMSTTDVDTSLGILGEDMGDGSWRWSSRRAVLVGDVRDGWVRTASVHRRYK